MGVQRIVDEAVMVLTSSTPTAPSAERNRLMRVLAGELVAAIDRPAAFDDLRAHLRSVVGSAGPDAAGDIFDALCHGTAVAYEGQPNFMQVIRTVADLGRRLEPEFVRTALPVAV